MNTQILSFAALFAVVVSLSCRPKPADGPSGIPADAGADHVADLPAERLVYRADAGNPIRPTYGSLQKELEEALARIPPPRTKEEYAASRIPVRTMLDRRKNLLFSIPISPKAERDRDEAWNSLEQNGYAKSEQLKYCKNLLKSYSDAPQLEKLVMWELLRCSIDDWSAKGLKGLGGVGTAQFLLRFEMAKLLFSALGINSNELFDATEINRRMASDAAGVEAARAEDEIERMHIEQSKVAERILEQHWRLSP